jgi:SpoVK/Ycf46/Vps4 family AAA+-type ATPase
VLWADEIEKAIGGAMDSNDGGVSGNLLGETLRWLNDHEGTIFCVFTANDVSKLPVELTRKGRFDEIFFVDLPTRTERVAVLATAIRRARRDPNTFDLGAVADASADFSGAELAELVTSGLYSAYENKHDLTTADMIDAAKDTVPMAVASAEKIESLRGWAANRVRRANDPEPNVTNKPEPRPIAQGFARKLNLKGRK